MSRPSVLISATPTLPVMAPSAMTYGGIQRAAYWYASVLDRCGFEVLPVVPADSTFPFTFDNSVLWSQKGLVTNGQRQFYAEDFPVKLEEYNDKIATVAAERNPDVLLLLGPRGSLIQKLEAKAPALLDRTIVSLRNGPRFYGEEMLGLLERRRSIRLAGLTDLHRNSFGVLASRIEVFREGVPVEAHRWSKDPAASRRESGVPWIDPSRKLITHLDAMGPEKGQLISLDSYIETGLKDRGYDLIFADTFGGSLPRRDEDPNGGQEIARRYRAHLSGLIRQHGLQDNVRFVGSMNGAQVELAYRCSDFVMAPHRMDHEDLWPGSAGQDPEAYGRAMGIALATGAPVLASSQVEPSRSSAGVTGYALSSISEAREAVERIADDGDRGRIDRAAIRKVAERNESIVPVLRQYVGACTDVLAENGRAVDISNAKLDQAIAQVTKAEIGNTASLLKTQASGGIELAQLS